MSPAAARKIGADPFDLSKKLFPKSPKFISPELPKPIPTTSTITEQAQQAGRTERRRIRGQKGKRGTIFAGRRDLAPAGLLRAGLKTTFG